MDGRVRPALEVDRGPDVPLAAIEDGVVGYLVDTTLARPGATGPETTDVFLDRPDIAPVVALGGVAWDANVGLPPSGATGVEAAPVLVDRLAVPPYLEALALGHVRPVGRVKPAGRATGDVGGVRPSDVAVGGNGPTAHGVGPPLGGAARLPARLAVALAARITPVGGRRPFPATFTSPETVRTYWRECRFSGGFVHLCERDRQKSYVKKVKVNVVGPFLSEVCSYEPQALLEDAPE